MKVSAKGTGPAKRCLSPLQPKSVVLCLLSLLAATSATAQVNVPPQDLGNQSGATVGLHADPTQISRAQIPGGLSPWTTLAQLPSGASAPSCATSNGFLYVLGGEQGGQPTPSVHLARALPDGGLTSWVDAPMLPQPRAGAAVLAYGGALYVAGGTGASGATTDVWMSRLSRTGALTPFRVVASLPEPRTGATLVGTGGSLYLLGGDTLGTAVNVLATQLAVDGTPGPWAKISQLPAARVNASVLARAESLLVAGGSDGTSLQSDAWLSYLTPDGGLSPWSATSSLPSPGARASANVGAGALWATPGQSPAWTTFDARGRPRSFASAPSSSLLDRACLLSVGDALYAIDGSTVQRTSSLPAPATPDPAPLSDFVAGPLLPLTRWSEALASSGTELYVAGGESSSSGFDRTQVLHATLAPDGTLSPWQADPDEFSGQRIFPRAFVEQGRFYVLGGYGSSLLMDVQLSPLQPDGMLSPFVGLADLRTARFGFYTAIEHGYLYVLGGNGAGPTTEYAPLRDGSIGLWTTTTAMPEAMDVFAGLSYGGYLFLFGGRAQAETPRSTVSSAPFLVDGGLGAWQTLTPLPVALDFDHAEALNGTVAVIGEQVEGLPDGGKANRVYTAPLLPGGKVGSWAADKLLAPARGKGDTITEAGQLFVVGGQLPDAGAGVPPVGVNAVSVATFLGADAHGVFERVLSLGERAVIAHSLTLQGPVGPQGRFAVRYRPALPDGTWGAWVSATPVGAGESISLGDVVTSSLFLSIALDDRHAVGATDALALTGLHVETTALPSLQLPRPAKDTLAGACSQAIEVAAVGSDGAALTPSSNVTVALSANASSGAHFFADEGCTQPISSLTLTSSAPTATFSVSAATTVTVTASASGYAPAAQTEQVSALAVRIAPDVSTLAQGGSVTLAATVAGAASGDVHYSWSETSGPAGVSVGTAASLHLTPPSPGHYVFSLVAKDSAGVTSPAVEAYVDVGGTVGPTRCGCGAGPSELEGGALALGLTGLTALARARMRQRRKRGFAPGHTSP